MSEEKEYFVYPAVILKDPQADYLYQITFPDVPNVSSKDDNLAKAIVMASRSLGEVLSNSEQIPDATAVDLIRSRHLGDEIVLIATEINA